MGWIGFIIFGLVIGALAKLVMPGRDSSPWWVTALMGMIGSLLATAALRNTGHYSDNQSAGWIASFFGALLVVFLWRMIRRPAHA
jgi:uncharacterized membrane protein YeaQ/YmgE (transglycosylase-associated protein family)